MRKWSLTALVVVALAALGFYARIWLPKILPVLRDHDNADLLQSLTGVVQIALWISGGLALMVKLWRPQKKENAPPAPQPIGGAKQTGGINTENSVLNTHDMIGRDQHITNITNVLASSATITPPEKTSALHQLPTPPADFTGRKDELEELLQAVKTGGATISGMHGLGGVGKTALALKLAEHLKLDYPDAQFYLDLRGVSLHSLTPRDAMAHVVRAYHPTAQLPKSPVEVRGLYLSVLHEKRALLLMDNASDAQQVAPLIPPAGCLLLVTSRKHFTLPGLFETNLDKLPPADARELLLRIATRLDKENPEQVEELARLCGYLPLALRAVASALQAKRNISPADYAQRLRDTSKRLVLKEVDPSVQTSVGAALQSSYELLSDDLRQRLRFLAVFPDTFDQAAAAAVLDIATGEAQDALGELLTYSLVEFDETAKRYGLHDLVRLFAGHLLHADEAYNVQKRHAGHYIQVMEAADDL